jgi:hypothetical protein
MDGLAKNIDAVRASAASIPKQVRFNFIGCGSAKGFAKDRFIPDCFIAHPHCTISQRRCTRENCNYTAIGDSTQVTEKKLPSFSEQSPTGKG